jgi:hypothetical protein
LDRFERARPLWSNSGSFAIRSSVTMKKSDLEKHLGKKIEGRMRREPTPDRYGSGSGGVADKRVQRERDKAAGLVPFAVKLPQPVVAALQARARERGASLDDVTADLLASALASGQS